MSHHQHHTQAHAAPRTEDNDLQKNLVYFVSPRGAHSFWASVVNGMSKRFTNDEGTLSVQLAPNYRYILTVHLPFYSALSPHMKLLVLVHEAAHVCLNHIPRLFKMLASCTDPFVRRAIQSAFNWAADMAANDSIVRLEPKFKDCHKAIPRRLGGPPLTKEELAAIPGEFPFILPEEFGFPTGKTMEEYLVLILGDLQKFKRRVEQLLKNFLAQMGDPTAGGGAGEDSDGDGEDSDGDGASPSRRARRPSSTPPNIPGLPESLVQHALNSPEIFEALQEAFDKLSHGTHTTWNEKAAEMTPEEAISAGSRMKKHAQALVRSAQEQQTRDRSRGYLPSAVQRFIDTLLEPEQIPWDLFLRDIIQGAITARVKEEMAAPNLSLINEDYLEPWPGQTLEFGYQITWMTDTSGSMSNAEYARACACMNSLLEHNKCVQVTYVECDAALQKEVQVSNIEPPSEEYLREQNSRRGYGGTVYTPFFRRIAGCDDSSDWVPGAPRLEDKHPKPDLIVVCTDGGVGLIGECFPQYLPNVPIIWLLMPGCKPCDGMDNVAPNRLIEMFSLKEE